MHYHQVHVYGRLILREHYIPNKYIDIGDGVTQLIITDRNTTIESVVLVDSQHVDLINKYQWSFDKKQYVVSSRGKIHRIVLGLENPKTFVDHIDGNKLNNLSRNLRIATNAENQMNKKSQAGSTSSFKGVSFAGKTCKSRPYRATIFVNGKQQFLGYHATEEQAALAYNEAAKQYFGEYARLNAVL